jgi:predicted helicase
VDFKVLDCVIIAEKMTSTIRIIQSLLRANRKNEDEPDKKSKIILPISYKDFQDKKSSEFGKIMNVIQKMSYEDERITQKIKLSFNEFNGVSLNKLDKSNDNSLHLTTNDIKKLTSELLLTTIPLMN